MAKPEGHLRPPPPPLDVNTDGELCRRFSLKQKSVIQCTAGRSVCTHPVQKSQPSLTKVDPGIQTFRRGWPLR